MPSLVDEEIYGILDFGSFCKGKNGRSVSKVIITQVMSGLCLVDVA